MEIQYSPDGNLMYIPLRVGEVAETTEFDEDIYVDFDADGRPVGVELLDASRLVPLLRSVLPDMAGVTVQLPGTLRYWLDRRYGVADEPATTDVEAIGSIGSAIGSGLAQGLQESAGAMLAFSEMPGMDFTVTSSLAQCISQLSIDLSRNFAEEFRAALEAVRAEEEAEQRDHAKLA